MRRFLTVKQYLEKAHDNLEIVVAFGMQCGLKLLDTNEHSLMLVSLPSEDKSVYEVLPLIRQATPIPIILEAPFWSNEMAQAYNLGADFCLQEPVGIDDLVGLLNAQYRRLTRISHAEYKKNWFFLQQAPFTSV